MIQKNELIEVGKFLKPHGLKGEMNVQSEYYSDLFEQGFPLIVEMDGIFVPFYAESARSKNTFSSLVKLDGVNSEAETRRFVNKYIYMLKQDVSEYVGVEEEDLAQDEDLIGYTILDLPTGWSGKVADMVDNGVYTLLEIEGDDGRSIMMPLVDEFISEADPDGKILKTKMPEGLIEDGKADSDFE